MEYEFFFADTASVHLTNAPRLPDSDLRSIANIMERNGRYYGSPIGSTPSGSGPTTWLPIRPCG